MTTSVSSPDAALLIPIGQPLGKLIERDEQTYYHVRLGHTTHRLELATAAVWLRLHQPRPGTQRLIDRALLAQLDFSDVGVADAAAELELLLDLGLVVELSVADDNARRVFADAYRLLPLQEVLGNTEQDLDSFLLIAGAETTSSIDAALCQLLIFSARHGSLNDACYVVSGGLGAVPETAQLGHPVALLEYAVARLGALLAKHGAYLDAAVDPNDLRESAKARLDKSAVDTSATSADLGMYAVGYLGGSRYMWLGLEDVKVRRGGRDVSLPTDEAWWVWTTAHGLADGQGINDDPKAICDRVREAGAENPEADLADQIQRGLIVQPADAAALVEFAATHRIQPLLAGIGNTSIDTDEYWLGVDSDNFVTALSGGDFEIWREAHLSLSLLDAAQAAGCAASVGDLRAYLQRIQVICARRAGYFDLVLDP